MAVHSNQPFPERLPVVVKKGRHQLEDLAEITSNTRWLCPHGKLTACVDSRGSVKIRDLCTPTIQCNISSHQYASCLWVNKTSVSPAGGAVSEQTHSEQQESYLLCVTSFRDLHFYSIQHHPTLYEGEEERGEGEGEGSRVALLPFKLVSTMSKRQITSILSKAQLGSSLQTLQAIGSEQGEIVLLANELSLLRISSHPSSHSLSLSAVFSIEANMECFDDDDLLPHYVGRIVDVVLRWPLLFSVTEDGIILIYNVITTKCIAAVNPLEYCRVFSIRQPETETLFQTLSSSLFHKLSVSHDLMKLVVSTSSHHILSIDLSIYFVAFPTHYSKSFHLKPTKRSPPLRRSQDTPITKEEELEMYQYGGITKRSRGLGTHYLGPFVGHFALHKRYNELRNSINDFDLKNGKGLSFNGVSKLSKNSEKLPVTSSVQKWYIPSEGAHAKLYNKDREGLNYDYICVTGLRKTRPLGVKNINSPNSAYSNYSTQSILPPPDDHVTSQFDLFHLDYSNGMVIAYYSRNNNNNNADDDDGEIKREEKEEKREEGGRSQAIHHIVIYKVSERFYSLAWLSRPHWLILPTNLDKPVYLVSETSLSVAAFVLSQEDFVAKVLMYGCAAVAEEVCHLNRWDQCSLPLNALETALELKQLDIVSFFLRNRDDSSELVDRKASLPDHTLPAPPPIPPDQLDAAVQLLSSVIKRNHDREHSHQFAGQLLRMTLNFLLKFLKTHSKTSSMRIRLHRISSGNELDETSNSEESHDITSQGAVISPADVTFHMHNLREYLPKGVGFSGEEEREEVKEKEGEFDRLLGDMVRKESWTHSNTEEVIQKGLSTNSLPLAQSYLIHRGSKGAESPHPHHHSNTTTSPGHAPSNDTVTMETLTSVGIGLVMKALTEKNLKLAMSYISQLGANIKDTIGFIFQHTLQRQLRDSLADLMSTNKWLTPIESQALEYMHLLETCYPVEIYESAKMIYSGSSYSTVGVASSPVNKTGNIGVLFPEYFGGDHAVVWEPVLVTRALSPNSERQRGLYIQVPVYVVLEWDPDTRQRILFDALVLSGVSKDLHKSTQLVSIDQQLLYHLSHHNTEAAIQLIDSLPPQTIYKLVTTGQSNQYCKDEILDKLVRNGFLGNKNLSDQLYHIGRLHNLFSKPHPLILDDDDQSNSFHISFIDYLVQKCFVGLLYLYLDHFKLGLNSTSIKELRLTTNDVPPWVQLLIQCRLTARNPTEPERVFSTSLSCSRFLFNTCSISEGLTSGRVLISLATLMYAPVPISEVINPSNYQEPWFVDENVMRQSLMAYPTLQAAIFPSQHTKLTPAQSQDVSMYELLKGNVHFDISRLFKWQRTNKYAAVEDSIDSNLELPSFSQPSLTQHSSCADKLTYTYYLHQGQPSFALANFVAVKLANKSNINKRIDRVITKCYHLVMRDFTNSSLLSSCVAFIEMLSRDSTQLRIDAQCAMRIYKYLKSNSNEKSGSGSEGRGSGSERKGSGNTRTDIPQASNNEHSDTIKKKIVSQFIQLSQSPDSHVITSLLNNLIKATIAEVEESEFSNCSVEAESFWLLVQKFCQYHSLPPTTAYLKECAKRKAWLPLLCHAQIHSISSKEVLSVVEKYFSDPIIKEHLQLALSMMSTTPTSASPALSESSINGRSKPRHKRKYIGGVPQKDKKATPTQGEGLTPRDVRANFYSRVGLVGSIKKEDKTSKATPTEHDSAHHPINSLPVDSLTNTKNVPLPPPIPSQDLPEDLLSVLFQCQDHQESPWRALLAYGIALQRPLLALLASSYEDSSLLDCMCVWLCSTVGSHSLKKVIEPLKIILTSEDQELHTTAALQWRVWSLEDLGLLLLATVLEEKSCPAAHFALLFHYFDEHNPLYFFMRFQEEFLLRCDLNQCKTYLNEFALQMDKCKVQGYRARIGNVFWVEEVATTFANHMIVTCPTPFERIQLYKLLAENGFGQMFTCQRLDFTQLYTISSLLNKAGLSSVPAFKFTVHFSPSPSLSHSLLEMYVVRVRMDGLNILQELVDKGQFTAAREYAKVADVPLSEVTLKEAESKYHKLVGTSYWKYQPARVNFWQQCHRSFITDRVRPEAAVEFFESIVKQSSDISHNEITILLVLSYQWKKETDLTYSEQEIEKEIWLSHIRAVITQMKSKSQQQPSLPELITDPLLSPSLHSRQISPSLLPILKSLSVVATSKCNKTAQIQQLVLPDAVPFVLGKEGVSLLDAEELNVLDQLIGRLLNVSWLAEARQLASLFQYDSPDLMIVLCCIQLAQGILSPDQLTPEVLELLANRPPRRYSSSTHSFNEGGGIKNKVSLEIIQMLQKLSDRANHAHRCCTCIITCFKIAVILRKSYSSVVGSEVYDVLAEILSSSSSDKYTLAKTFVNSTNMQAKEVAGFLSDCIAASLQSYIGGEEREYSKVRVYEPHMTTANFMLLAQLCGDHALLGSHLLSMTKSLYSTEQPSEASLSMQVEMLIRSHDCYSLGCSVDGIAEILKVAREITSSLYRGKHYKLMVRLLTGVGRFHEMSYIIQLLLECDEFESLVHHGVEKVEQLRIALMDYLRKNCHHDHEKRQMVAFKFGMHRELAKTREEQAMKDIRRLKNKHLGSDSIQLLKRIFSDLRDASKIYAQNSCLSNAEMCLSQARLVALQLSLLQSNKVVLNMEIKEVHRFMEQQPFSEALIVADAYKQSLLADWVNPLYKMVVIKGNMRYLNDFRSVFTLTPTIVQELASRYLLDKTRPPEATNNIKTVLAHCPNIVLRHKLTQQLGLPTDTSSSSRHGAGVMNEGFLKDIAKL